jgi:hypothetical protein
MNLQIRYPCEVPDVVGHESHVIGDSRSSNQEIEIRDQLTLATQAVSDLPESPQGCWVKLNNGERREERVNERQFRFGIRRGSDAFIEFPIRNDTYRKSCTPQSLHCV